MDNLDRIQEIFQCIGRLWNARDVYNESVDNDLMAILDNTKRIKAELLDLLSKSNDSIKHGYWLFLKQKRGYLWKCSNCKGNFDQQFSYCPHCGAKMDGGVPNVSI